PYQILLLMLHIRGEGYRGSSRVTSSSGGSVTLQITSLEPDEGTHVPPQGQWISGYRAPITSGNAPADVPPAPSPAPLRSVALPPSPWEDPVPAAAPVRAPPVVPNPAAPPPFPVPPLEEPVAAPPRPRSPAIARQARRVVAGFMIGVHDATDLGRV